MYVGCRGTVELGSRLTFRICSGIKFLASFLGEEGGCGIETINIY